MLFRSRQAPHKMKKSGDAGLTLSLLATPDILAELSRGKRAGQVVVGFAAETGDDQASVIEHGRAKLARKGCDALVVNDVRGDLAFGSDTNEVVILMPSGSVEVPRAAKAEVADAVWSAVVPLTVRVEGRN